MVRRSRTKVQILRTTVTFEPDVYAQLKRLGADQDFKPFINNALRRGLAELERDRQSNVKIKVFKLPSFSGKPVGFDVDNVHRLLAEIEGEN